MARRRVAHSSSRWCLSRSVSIGCQKPSCCQAISSPSAASCCSGSCSQTVESSFRYFRHLRAKHEVAAVDQRAITLGLFLETDDAVLLDVERTEAPRRVSGGQRRDLAVLAVEIDRCADIDVGDTVAVGEAEGFLVANVLGHAQQAAASHRVVAGVDEGHVPWLGALVMHLHAVRAHVESHIRHVQEVVGEVLLDDVALVATADHEVVDAVVRIGLQDMPEDRLAADLDHRLRAQGGFLAEARAEAAGQYDCFHSVASVFEGQFELTKASARKRRGGKPAAVRAARASSIMAGEPQA